MKDSYSKINGEFENTLVIERSKFICFLKGIEDEEEAKAYVEYIKKKHSMATHNCYAYIADSSSLIQKFSDDGEPQGTAGYPILEVLKKLSLSKTVAVVTRYFGGIKLGTGGLVRAYGNSVIECVSQSKIGKYFYSSVGKISCDYEQYSRFLKFCSSTEDIKILDTNFDFGVKLELAVKEEYVEEFNKKISDISSGKCTFELIYKDYFCFKVIDGEDYSNNRSSQE